MCWWLVYFMFWNSVLGVAARTSLRMVVELQDSSWSHRFPGIWTLSIFLSPHLRTFASWIWCDPRMSPYASMITLLFIVVHRIDRMSQVLRKIPLRAPQVALHKVDRCSPHWNHWSWRCRRKSLLDLFLTWRSAFRSDQKEISKMAAREHPETHHVEQTKQMIPLVTRKLPLVRISANEFWVSTYLIWILGSNLILWNNQSSATLWVLDTCLIVELRLLIILLMTASVSSKV